MLGISWHNRFQRLRIDSPPVFDAVAMAQDDNLVWVFHCVADSAMEAPWRLEPLAAAFPNQRFLVLSSLGSTGTATQMYEICQRRHNIMLDLGVLHPVGLWIERLVKKIGSERFLFGTDFYTDPMSFRHNYVLRELEAAHVSDEARENILYKNAIRYFRLPDLPS